ncbi:MAG: hypothetical protein AB8H79_14675 [Myxococcota bacterium]
MTTTDDDLFRHERTTKVRRHASGVFAWAVLGLVLGGLAAGVPLLYGDKPAFLFVTICQVLGAGGGAALGFLDLPRSLVPRDCGGRALMHGIFASVSLTVPVGALWAGLVGAIASLGSMLQQTTSLSSEEWVFAGIIIASVSFMAVTAVTPGVFVFTVIRAVQARDEPAFWHLPSQLLPAGMLTAMMSTHEFTVLFLMLGS